MCSRKHVSLLVLAACIAAALVFRRFVFVAWYPVVMSVAVATGFGMSLVRGEPLCLTVARRIPPGILPDGAEPYARKCTLFWTLWLLANALIAAISIFMPGPMYKLPRFEINVPWMWIAWNCCLSYCATLVIGFLQMRLSRRRFSAVFHTSGSTSTPKTIVKPFDTLAREVAYHLATLRSESILPSSNAEAEKPVFLCTIEPGHMYGMLWRRLLPREAGCAVDPEVIMTPESLLAKMRGAKKVFLVTTPSFLDRFCAYADQYEVPQNCVEITTSGALLTAETSASAKRVFGVAPREIFGSTETGGVAWRRQGEGDSSNGDEFDWRVLDPVKVAVNAEGRLVVRSPFSFCRRYAMGDGVVLSPDRRRFKLLGRLDRMVKINEERVSLPEMELKVQQVLAGVKEVALVVLEGRHGPALGAVMAADESARLSVLELRRRLLDVFPKGTLPKRFRYVDELPRNPQGKVQAAKLKELFDVGA